MQISNCFSTVIHSLIFFLTCSIDRWMSGPARAHHVCPNKFRTIHDISGCPFFQARHVPLVTVGRVNAAHACIPLPFSCMFHRSLRAFAPSCRSYHPPHDASQQLQHRDYIVNQVYLLFFSKKSRRTSLARSRVFFDLVFIILVYYEQNFEVVPCGTTMHDQNEKQIILATLRKRLLHTNLWILTGIGHHNSTIRKYTD